MAFAFAYIKTALRLPYITIATRVTIYLINYIILVFPKSSIFSFNYNVTQIIICFGYGINITWLYFIQAYLYVFLNEFFGVTIVFEQCLDFFNIIFVKFFASKVDCSITYIVYCIPCRFLLYLRGRYPSSFQVFNKS